MSAVEEKIIDLVDVITEPKRPGSRGAEDGGAKATYAEVQHRELEQWVRNEVERLIRKVVEENVQKMIREVMIEEVEKAINREMEKLRKT